MTALNELATATRDDPASPPGVSALLRPAQARLDTLTRALDDAGHAGWSLDALYVLNRIRMALATIGKDTSGATAIEYGLIAALVSIAAIGAFSALGTNISGTFANIASQL